MSSLKRNVICYLSNNFDIKEKKLQRYRYSFLESNLSRQYRNEVGWNKKSKRQVKPFTRTYNIVFNFEHCTS